MKKKGKAIGMLIVVALLMLGVGLVAAENPLLYRMVASINTTGDVTAGMVGNPMKLDIVKTAEPLSITVDDNTLEIDETGGIHLWAHAGSYEGPYIPGVSYKIVVDCTYTDTPDVIGKTAYFKITGPDGTVDDKSIFDRPGPDDSWAGTLSVTFTPSAPGAYHWTIYCSEGGESTYDTGDLILH
jgi:hypothetical protein